MKPNISCTDTAKDWTEDFGHENGRYQGQCLECRSMFYGHKRRHVCRECALPFELDPQDDADFGHAMGLDE